MLLKNKSDGDPFVDAEIKVKIIKVVHSEIKEQLEYEKQSFAIQTYDAEAFIKKEISEKVPKRDLNRSEAGEVLRTVLPIVRLFDLPTPQLVYTIREVSLDIIKDIQEHLEKLEILPLETAKRKYPRTRNLSVGTYTLHPYDSAHLTRLESYHTDLAMEKDDELIILLGKMGAKTINIVESASRKKTGYGKLKGAGIIASAEGQINISQQKAAGKDLLVSFEGNVVDIDPNLLSTSLWFSTDSKLHSIFESRRFNSNKIEQYTLKNTYTETFDFDFELAGKYLGVKADLKVQYNSLSQKERIFHVAFSKAGTTKSSA